MKLRRAFRPGVSIAYDCGMNRPEAERVFRLVAELQGELRDRFVPDRWWLVWTLMGVEILCTNVATHVLLSRGIARPGPHFAVFGAQVVALAATIRIAQRRGGGVRPQREAFVWWIWTTFLIAAASVGALNILLGLPFFTLAPILPLLAAVSFSAMAMVVARSFLAASVAFAACAFLMALAPAAQFLTYGACWFIVLESFGIAHRPRGRREGRSL